MADQEEGKLHHEDFFKLAILNLRDTSKSYGIHSVFSGFNEAFRRHFGEDPVRVTQELAKQGKIEIRPVKRGVMIYLPGEAPTSRKDLGETALSKILGKPAQYDKSLVEQVLSEITTEGIKTFPQDFLGQHVVDKDMLEIEVASTPLQLDPNSQLIVISPKRYFRYEAKNPPEAKYIIYAHKIGDTMIKIPNDNRVVFKAVANYEKYCQEIEDQCFALFLKRVNNENAAERLTKEVLRKLDLRVDLIKHK